MIRPTVDLGAADDLTVAAALAGQAGVLLVERRAEAFAAGKPGREIGRSGDLESNELLLAALSVARPDDAVLSEESADVLSRLDADRLWIIDPLDGTREYSMPGRSDWAVHVALWERRAATIPGSGVTAAAVALPAQDLVLTGHGDGAVLAPRERRPIRTVVSDSRPPDWLGALGAVIQLDVRPMGSAGAKAMAVLTGEADAYVHSGGQYEWDSAAPVGVVEAAGLHASRLDGGPLRYNQVSPYLPDLVICRPELAAPLLAALADIGAA